MQNISKLLGIISKYGGVILALFTAIEVFKSELEKIEKTAKDAK